MNTKEDLLEELKNKISNYNKEEIDSILAAYEFSKNAHEGQKRASGEEFIIHPIWIAIILAEMNVYYKMIMAGLLHDVVEDTNVKLEELKKIFGDDVGTLVDGVTKISKLKPAASKHTFQTETIRKMLLAMIKDMKIIVIKLADKIHNMRTLNFLPPQKRKLIAKETLELYAPLAGKLGMQYIKDHLEDLALRYIQPDIYKIIHSYFDRTEKDRERTKIIIARKLEEKLKTNPIPFTIKSRTKHYYSIYKKMKKYNKNINEIFDLYGVRIITDTIENCYLIFGIIHSIWQPITTRFRDFIAHPKKNGYRSLHTTVILEKRKAVEIQIRTEEMHEFNEYGVASHWYYKKGEDPDTNQLKWLTKLKEVHKEQLSPEDYYAVLRDEILKDEIFVFTPKGDIIELPKGSTPIDFAYRIHTEVGHRCKGAKANGIIWPLNRALKNGAIVDIITGKNQDPKQSWLSFVTTSNARKKIKTFFASKKHEEPISKEEKHHKPDDKEKPAVIKHEIFESGQKISPKITIQADGENNMLFNFAKCCNPLPTDNIIGFISRGRGIIIHKTNCHNVKYIKDIDKRVIDVKWVIKTKNKIHNFFIRVNNIKDYSSMISNVIQKYSGNVIKWDLFKDTTNKKILEGQFSVEFSGNVNINEMFKEIRKIPDVHLIEKR